MAYLSTFICFLLLVYSICISKIRFNPLSVFLALWTTILFLSSLRLYNLLSASDASYLIILLGVFSFTLGYLVLKHFYRCSNNRKNASICDISTYIYIFWTICVIVYISDFVKIFPQIISGGGLAAIRSLAQNSNSVLYIGRTGLDNAVRMLVVEPFSMVLPVIFSVTFWSKQRNRTIVGAMLLSIIFLRMLTDGSRSLFLYTFFHFLIIGYIFNRRNKSKKQSLLQVNFSFQKIFIIIFLVVVIFVASFSRLGNQTLLQNLYYYFSMEPYMFDHWSQHIVDLDSYGFGSASLNGYIYPIIYIVKNFFSIEYPSYWYNQIFLPINDTDQVWIPITSDGAYANAYVSIFFFPFLDARFIGVFLCLFFIGFFAAKLFTDALTLDIKSIAFYSLFLQGILMSFVRLQFANTAYALAFVYCCFLLKRKISAFSKV